MLGWRELPIDPSQIGVLAAGVMPAFEQLFLAAVPTGPC